MTDRNFYGALLAGAAVGVAATSLTAFAIAMTISAVAIVLLLDRPK